MSLLALGNSYKDAAKSGFRDLSILERRREAMNENLRQNEKMQGLSMAASGAGIGFMAGGPIGAGIGAAAGFLFSKLF